MQVNPAKPNTTRLVGNSTEATQSSVGAIPQSSRQFSIASLLCTMGTLAVLLTYLKVFEPDEFIMGLQVVILMSLVGFAIGAFFERGLQTAYLAVLGAMTAFLCAVGEPLTHELFQYAWPCVGALTAASTIVLDRYGLVPRMLVGALIGGTVLALFSWLPSQFGATNTWIEVACGPVAGAIMVGVVWILETLRTWRSYSRAGLIFALTVGVIGGNVVGRFAGLL